jgi:hypothetical protein
LTSKLGVRTLVKTLRTALSESELSLEIQVTLTSRHSEKRTKTYRDRVYISSHESVRDGEESAVLHPRIKPYDSHVP